MTFDKTTLDDMLMDAVVVRLTTDLKSTVTDSAKARTIRAGLLQDSPQDNRITVLVHPGGPDWPDVLNEEDKGPGAYAPTHLLGGGSFWRLRFRLEITVSITGNSRLVSRKKAQLVFKRARHSLITWQVGEVGADSFGEHPFLVQVKKLSMEEGGGDGDFNWNGEIWWEVMTEYSPT